MNTTNSVQFGTLSMMFTVILRKLNREVEQFYEGQRDKKNLK